MGSPWIPAQDWVRKEVEKRAGSERERRERKRI